jgi:hydroxyquinol 1,2-dioxygenase
MSDAGEIGRLRDQVLASYADAPDPRLRELLRTLSRHLFAFIEETQLTQAEWLQAIDFLTAVGQACTATHQECMLLSDVLGVSTLVMLIDQVPIAAATVGTVLGPVYHADSPERSAGASMIERDDGGPQLAVSGTVRGVDGRAISGAVVDVWGCAANGLYPSQDPQQPPHNLRGKFRTDEQGRYAFVTLRPQNYSVPTGGPVGGLLRTTRRSPLRAAHLHLWVRAPGCRDVITHVFDAASPYLGSDAAFSVSDSLVVPMADGGAAPAPVRFDVILAPR